VVDHENIKMMDVGINDDEIYLAYFNKRGRIIILDLIFNHQLYISEKYYYP